MKKILLLIESLGSGGAERQICGLASFLTQAGYTCRLVTYVENQFYEPYLRQNDVEYEFVPSLSNKYLRIFRAAKYVRDYRPDIVISYLPSVNMTMCLAKLFYKSKLIVSERNNNSTISFKDKLLFNLYRLADVVVPNSNSQGDFISKNFPFLSSKVHPIINFVDLNRFSPAEKTKVSDKLIIVAVARYAYQKNVLAFLQVVRKVKDAGLNVQFIWYGDKEHDQQYYQRVENEYNKLDIADYILLKDSCREIQNEYNKSDVLMLPSLFEGYPNVIAEAMASGLPILCSDRYENPYIVEDGVNGFLFNPESVDSMFESIKKMLNLTKNQREDMGTLNRRVCLERNTEEKFLKSYIDLIETL